MKHWHCTGNGLSRVLSLMWQSIRNCFASFGPQFPKQSLELRLTADIFTICFATIYNIQVAGRRHCFAEGLLLSSPVTDCWCRRAAGAFLFLIRKMAGWFWFLFLKFLNALDRGSPVETASLFPARAWQWPVFIPTVFTKIRRSVSNFGRGKTFNFPKNFQTKSQLYLYVIWLRLKSSFIIKTSALVHSRTNF